VLDSFFSAQQRDMEDDAGPPGEKRRACSVQ
jgi:hypothetical protein